MALLVGRKCPASTKMALLVGRKCPASTEMAHSSSRNTGAPASLLWFLSQFVGSHSGLESDAMEQAKMASPKSAPKDAQVMAQILKDMGITEYEPRVINQMLEFTYRYVTTILEDAKIYSSHAKKNNIDADDVRLSIQCRTDQSFTSPPPRDFLLDIARQKNQTPLPLIKPYAGPRLPPDRYCLTAPNYRLKTIQKKLPAAGRITVPRLSVGAVTSRPSTPTLVGGTPVTLGGQRFTVQIPTSQTTVKTATPTTATVQNVLINPSLISSKNILITTNMVSSQNAVSESNPLKRKLEEDEDYDAL
ncbi:transcription initiation factor TFIID subunit 9B-like isoform X2 [Mixophyes fleayi]|uniref:transcription initiation factor TFIID subunit 9B-like isoform X2 n=1 Tax=Mixophyes fleayi TaxID=3061075 RepID=UPI003F4DCC18